MYPRYHQSLAEPSTFGSAMITGFIYFWILMVVIIAAYRRSRGLDDSTNQTDWFERMKDREESERLVQQGYDEAERIRRMNDQVSEDYERQRNYELFS